MSRYTKTAQQLSETVPWIVFLLLGGYVNVMFPGSSPARYAPFVKIQGKKPWPGVVPSGLSLYFDGKQWNTVVVPILKDVQTTGWRGDLPSDPGEVVQLLQDLYGPEGVVVGSEGEDLGTLAGSEVPQTGVLYQATEYVAELGNRTLRLAIGLGY